MSPLLSPKRMDLEFGFGSLEAKSGVGNAVFVCVLVDRKTLPPPQFTNTHLCRAAVGLVWRAAEILTHSKGFLSERVPSCGPELGSAPSAVELCRLAVRISFKGGAYGSRRFDWRCYCCCPCRSGGSGVITKSTVRGPEDVHRTHRPTPGCYDPWRKLLPFRFATASCRTGVKLCKKKTK